jgi:hypothetical protein
MSVLGSHLPLKKCFRIQGTYHTPNTVVLAFCVNVSIKSQQAMKTAMTPISFARIRPFVWLKAKTKLMRQASYSCQDLKTKSWVTGRDFKLWTVPPLPEGKGYFLDDGFCDFAFGSAQNDRVGGMLVRVKVFISKKPTKNESIALCMGQ